MSCGHVVTRATVHCDSAVAMAHHNVAVCAGTVLDHPVCVWRARCLQVFWHVTLPNIRWGLMYGVILTNARAMGEFGAVSVISGM